MSDESYQIIWDKTLKKLESHINYTTFDTFFKKMTLVGYYDGVYVVATNDEVAANLLPQVHIQTIEKLLTEVSGFPAALKIVARPSDVESLNLKELKRPKKENHAPDENNCLLLGQYRINPQNTFDTFVVGKSNQFAHAASLAIAENMAQSLSEKKVYNPLFIYGGSGLGKTHLMHAIAHHIIKDQPEAKIIYVSCENFTNELIDTIRDNRMTQFRSKYRKVDVLLIDDIQFLSKKEGTQEEFFHTFNELYEANKQIIISSDCPPKEIPKLEERIRTRFEWGLITDIQPPDLETRIAILRKKAQRDGKKIDADVTMFMAEHMETNIRELEGALLSLTCYATMNDLPLNLDVAKNFLSTYVSLDKPRHVTGATIQEKICEIYNVTTKELSSKSRKKEIVFPRQLAMYLCRELTDMSLPKIGDLFGGRDHTTVIHAVDKIQAEMDKNPVLQATVQTMIKELKGE